MSHFIPRTVAAAALICLAAAPRIESSSFQKKAFQNEYRQILELYAAGDPEAAVERMMQVESSATGEATEGQIERIWRAKLGVIRDLLGVSPDALLPICLLHEKAYLAYREQNQLPLAIHSRTMAVELIEFYAKRVEHQEGREVASGVLASLAGHLQEAYMAATGAVLYNEALSLDPSNETALLNLAALFEKNGEYERAVPYLRRLVGIHEANSEGRLRLAINLARLEMLHEARQEFRRLLEKETTQDWVRVLAYQELARTFSQEGDWERAAALLEEGVERLPEEPSLAIQLAYVRQRGGFAAATGLESRLDDGAGRASPSPRFLYSQMPTRALEDLRARLADYTAHRLATLNQALAFSSSIEMYS